MIDVTNKRGKNNDYILALIHNTDSTSDVSLSHLMNY